MSDWRCAMEHKVGPNAHRCKEQCESCMRFFAGEEHPHATLETYCGHYFDFNDPKPEQIDVNDIARALSQSCRFGGHVGFFYSVAEHALLVRSLVYVAGFPELGLAALHHDSHEAYLGDWPTPLKRAVSGTHLQELQEKTDDAIGARFEIHPDLFEHDAVKTADLKALYQEAATLKDSGGVGPFWGRTDRAEALLNSGLSPERAEQLFLRAHEEEMERCA